MAFEKTEGFAVGWDDEITTEARGDFEPIPAGFYICEVTGIEYDTYQQKPNSSMGTCPEAIVELLISGHEIGNRTVTKPFFMWSTLLWRSANLFEALKLPKNAEGGYKVGPTWQQKDKIIGKKCWVEYKDGKPYVGKDGKEHQTTEIARFYAEKPARADKPTQGASESKPTGKWGANKWSR